MLARRGPLLAAACALFAALTLAGCAGTGDLSSPAPGASLEDPAGEQVDESNGDCITPFDHDHRTYRLVLGAIVEPPMVGALVGEGNYRPCSDSDTTLMTPEGREVYELIGVPVEEAVVLRGTYDALLVNIQRPPDGWNPALQSWLDESGEPAR